MSKQQMNSRGQRYRMGHSANFIGDFANGAGYDTNMASAELLDNGIGAGAEVIKITIKNNIYRYADFGQNCGMDESTLKNNFFYMGRSSTKLDPNAPGMFGVGGKTGILCMIGQKIKEPVDVHIITHKKGCTPIEAWWQVAQGNADFYDVNPLTIQKPPYGTSIEFQYDREIDIESLKRFIGVTYCWAIKSGLKVYVNDELIEAQDPLYRDNPNVVNNGIFSTKTFHITPIKGSRYDVIVNISAFNMDNIIPEDELNSWDSGGKKTRTLRTANRSGIYVRTGGRYYTFGNNFGKVMKRVQHPSLDGLRIEVCIPKSLWDVIGITWNKGNEVSDFTKVWDFNVGKPSIVEYIIGVMQGFANNKKTKDEKTSDKLGKYVAEALNIQNSVRPFHTFEAGKNVKGKWVDYDGENINIDVTQTDMTFNEMKGAVRVILPMAKHLISNGFGYVDTFLEAVNK